MENNECDFCGDVFDEELEEVEGEHACEDCARYLRLKAECDE